MSLQLIENGLNNSELLKTQLGSRHNKYVISVLNEIKKTANDDKKSLVNCTPDSIISAIKQACDLQLEIDGRQHCHLVKYNKNTGTKESPKWISEAQLQVGYRGFIYSIKRAYPDANIDCKLVYEGDSFVVKSEGDTTTYSLEIKDPFSKKEKIIGGYCHISYTLGGRLVSFCETMSLAEINKIKGKAKQDSIWQEWFEEKAKVAIIRRACKIHFSGIQQIEQITEFDNQDYDLEKVVELEIETIDSEQGIEIGNLAKIKGVDVANICKFYGIDLIIDLPASKFEQVINQLKKKPDVVVDTKAEVKDA
jgi:phage RecT family recombinase